MQFLSGFRTKAICFHLKYHLPMVETLTKPFHYAIMHFWSTLDRAPLLKYYYVVRANIVALDSALLKGVGFPLRQWNFE